jgi:hypothetical protein
MQSNELRIDNYVYKSLKSGNGRKLINRIGCQDIVRVQENIGSFNYEPIPLTEEWLLKFGFKKTEYKSDIIYDSGLQNSTYITIDNNYSSYFMWGEYLTSIKYVHELQNLYFALIRTELILKD